MEFGSTKKSLITGEKKQPLIPCQKQWPNGSKSIIIPKTEETHKKHDKRDGRK